MADRPYVPPRSFRVVTIDPPPISLRPSRLSLRGNLYEIPISGGFATSRFFMAFGPTFLECKSLILG